MPEFSKKELSEQDICSKYILPALTNAGWDLQNQIRGVELKPLPHLLAMTNMILHGADTPKSLRRGDMLAQLLREYGPKDRVQRETRP